MDKIPPKGIYHLKYAGIFLGLIIVWVIVAQLIDMYLPGGEELAFKGKRLFGYVLLYFQITNAIKWVKGAKKFES
ncbi:hypothetical protein [uncultured Shewanella sp.]|uniref:hypothetical protein n=1 Tax=uncultured Shewanella sp. TaxID=173975 RepID=UPI00262D16E8|nr:hypothetical protein [uncultured Shewanella sp.]